MNELVKHSVAATAAVETGCNSAIVKLSFAMYENNRLIQVHKASTYLVPENDRILAGCGSAVHYFKSTRKVNIKEEGKEGGRRGPFQRIAQRDLGCCRDHC